MSCQGDTQALMIGLDGAGKTTLLYNLKLGSRITVIPTIGFNIESIEWNKFTFSMWDVGGSPQLRPLWRHYYGFRTRAVIFVIDSTDKKRINSISKDKSKLLISGYIHQYEDQYDMTMPMELNEIFVDFYHESNEIESSAKEEFYKVLNEDELQHCCFLVLCNKQECSDALSVEEIKDILEWDFIKQEKKHLKIKIFGICADRMQGVDKALDWMVSRMRSS